MFSVAKVLLRVVATAAMLAILAPLSALAQNPPGLGPTDHYKVYRLQQQPTGFIGTVGLRDQFGFGNFEVAGPVWFSPPAQKNAEIIHTPRFHMTWYDIFSPIPDPTRRVIAHNQFGSTELEVTQARWLLVPSLKNEPLQPQPFPTFPVNHFKCYFATGNFVVRTVTLTTQFGTEVVQVGAPEFLCNPVEKTHQGLVDPIEWPADHLVCYGISVTPPLNAGIQRQDQFGASTNGILLENRWLCVPSLKEIPTATEVTTWGRVRAQYR